MTTLPRVVTISGSPSASSRTFRLLRHVGRRVAEEGFDVVAIDVRDFPPDDLMHARAASSELAASFALIESAAGIVVGSPIYKAAYSGLLKTFFDVLPPRAFSGKIVLPILTGSAPTHALALDYALCPVLKALGAPHVLEGLFVHDKQIGGGDGEAAAFQSDAERQLIESARDLTRALRARTAQDRLLG